MALDTGTTAWLLTATALVMLMTPAVGFFYGGMVRRKNLIAMIALSFIAFALVSVQWVVAGYTLAFGPDISGIIGGLEYLGLSGIGLDAGDGAYPPILFVAWQLVFAAVSLLADSAGFELSPDSPLDSLLDSPLDVSTRLRFFSASPLKSVSYQPPPFNLNTGAEIKRRSVSFPHSGHLRSGESLIFCSASSSCEQLPQRYS
jgi:hypothetical protein